EVRERIEPLRRELESLGFSRPIYHLIHQPLLYTHTYWATFLHPSGRAVARIHHRVWSHPNTFRTHLFPVFLTEMNDGSFIVSSGGKPDLIAPASVQVHHEKGATARDLWELHQRRLSDLYAGSVRRVDTQDQIRALIDRHHP